MEPINEAIALWRAELTGQSAPQTTTSTPPDRILRARIWDKIEPSLAGCSSVTVIPDGALSFVPWAALPGRRAGSYLLEDYALATAQSGHQLYACLTAPRGESQRMLLVGGVAHDSRPTEQTPSTDLLATAERTRGPAITDRRHWDFLAGSRDEVEAIETLCGDSIKPLLLQGAAADEAALRRDMPGSRYVHLATHGFFADARFRSMFGHDVGGEDLFGDTMGTRRRAGVTTRNPLILSGVVLAGANLSPKTDELGLPTGEDGVLTAEEIVALDLRDTDLVVLSACDTGLGDVAGGEGVMGLQRAFHLAGARTVVASLWKVEDNATRALMTEFYKNLWEKKLGKLESLRQAQLAMLERYSPRQGKLRAAVRLDQPDLAAEPSGSLPPRYWAAFSLSGQCRPTSLAGD